MTVTADGPGTAQADTESAVPGIVVTLTAEPEAGCIFGGWSVAEGDIVLLPDAESNPATFVMPEGGVSIGARFYPFLETVEIPAGTFLMGSPSDEPKRGYNERQHEVTISRGFLMGKYEVTNAQFAFFLNDLGVGADAMYPTPGNGMQQLVRASTGNALDSDLGLHYIGSEWIPVAGCENRPAMNISWYGADEFARWIGGALPTEAQWEYACRGDRGTLPFGIGSGRRLDGTNANILGTYPYDLDRGGESIDENGVFLNTTTDVGSYSPNSFGLYDMHGNMWEWCSDWYDVNYGNGAADAVDPTGPSGGATRVVRGGGWTRAAKGCRSAMRVEAQPHNMFVYYGFRVVFAL